MRFAHVREMQIWFCSLFLFTTLTISAHENIDPRGETLKLETRDSTKHSLGPTKRRKQQTMNPELWSKPLLFFPCQVCNLLLYSFRSRTKFSFHHCSASSRSLRFKCPLGHGLAGAQNFTNWVSVGIGWGIGGSCL